MDTFTCDLLRRCGYEPELPAVETAPLQALKTETMCGHVGVDDYWDAWLRAHGVAAADERGALRRQILAQADRVVALPGAQSTLAALKERGLTIGIITDTMYLVARKTKWLASIGVADLIDVMACSTVLGIRKPDSAIYRSALNEARLHPDEAVFVGHDTGEIAGAHRVGMTTIGVNADVDARADISLSSLSELLTVQILRGVNFRIPWELLRTLVVSTCLLPRLRWGRQKRPHVARPPFERNLLRGTPVFRLPFSIACTVPEDARASGHLIPDRFILDQEIDAPGGQRALLVNLRPLLNSSSNRCVQIASCGGQDATRNE